jgi:multidrug efflux pump subunit AcrA (membrane-fusion protein)
MKAQIRSPRTRHVRNSALLVLGAAAFMALAGCPQSKKGGQEEPKAVSVARAVRSSLAVTLEYPARIRARQEIVVSSKVPGRVETVKADVGQRVAQGEVLFTLESTDYETQSRQAQAALGSAQANLTRTSDSSLSSQVIQAQAAVKQAQIQYDDANDLFGRTQKLFNQGSVSRQQLDSVKSKLDSAGIQLDTAKQNLNLIQDKGGPQSTGVATTQVDQAQAAADLAESQLSNAIIRSPLAGVVAARNVDPGELVGSGVPAFVVIDVGSVTAETSVEEGLVRTIRVGQQVPVAIDAAGIAKVLGTVQSVSPAADARTQAYTVKIRIDNPGDAVRPGMFARITFPVDTRRNVLTVPNTAVVTETGISYVYAVVRTQGASVVKKIPVISGLSDETVTEITSGIDEGAVVITEGQSFLTDGQAVTPAP